MSRFEWFIIGLLLLLGVAFATALVMTHGR
jgi:hypothetical protein